MGALKEESETSVHQMVRFGDSEALVPVGVSGGAVPLDRASFAKLVENADRDGSPVTPVDHLVLAVLSWSVVPNSPEVDASADREAIQASLADAVQDPDTRIPATHLRGVMRLLGGDFAGARSDFSEVVAARPAAIGTRYLLGMTLLRLGLRREAREPLEEVALQLPKSHRARSRLLGHLAVARAGAGDLEGAMGACREWWTDCRDERQWVDLVVPRVLAARLAAQERRSRAGARPSDRGRRGRRALPRARDDAGGT